MLESSLTATYDYRPGDVGVTADGCGRRTACTYVPLDAFVGSTDTLAVVAPFASTYQSEDSMAINTNKVLLGGFVAGVVINVIDFVVNVYVLAARNKAEMDAFKPGLSDQMMAGSSIASYIIMDFVLGFALVWTYAAIRPRFGPGLRTATYAAILFWLLAMIFTSGFRQMGIMSSGLWWTYALIGLVNFYLASWAGAKLYSEDTVA